MQLVKGSLRWDPVEYLSMANTRDSAINLLAQPFRQEALPIGQETGR